MQLSFARSFTLFGLCTHSPIVVLACLSRCTVAELDEVIAAGVFAPEDKEDIIGIRVSKEGDTRIDLMQQPLIIFCTHTHLHVILVG
jgi:hypothetical protein